MASRDTGNVPVRSTKITFAKKSDARGGASTGGQNADFRRRRDKAPFQQKQTIKARFCFVCHYLDERPHVRPSVCALIVGVFTCVFGALLLCLAVLHRRLDVPWWCGVAFLTIGAVVTVGGVVGYVRYYATRGRRRRSSAAAKNGSTAKRESAPRDNPKSAKSKSEPDSRNTSSQTPTKARPSSKGGVVGNELLALSGGQALLDEGVEIFNLFHDPLLLRAITTMQFQCNCEFTGHCDYDEQPRMQWVAH